MKTIVSSPSHYLLRVDRGEDVVIELKNWAESMGAAKIHSASLSMLGAADHVVIGYYHLDKKVFEDKTIDENVEILAVNGNIAWKKDDAGNLGAVIHCHGTFTDSKFAIHGGHIKSMRASIVCEVAVTIINGDGPVLRALDERSGLAILQ